MKPHLPLALVATLLTSSFFAEAAEPTEETYVFTAEQIENSRPGVWNSIKNKWDSLTDTQKTFTYTKYAADEGSDTTISFGSEDAPLDITNKNIWFTAGSGTTTITAANVKNDTPNSGSNSAISSGKYAFIVEHEVVIDGADLGDIKNSLSVGTMVSNTGTATLRLKGGAQLETSGYYNSVGATNGSAAIYVEGPDTVLKTQQITIGNAYTNGLQSAYTSWTEPFASSGATWTPDLMCSTEDYNTAMQRLSADYTQCQAKISISDGGKMVVAEGNTVGTSTNKLQIYNGSVTVEDEGSSLVMAGTGKIIMSTDRRVLNSSSSLIAKNGGRISTQVEDNQSKKIDVIVGQIQSTGQEHHSAYITAMDGGRIEMDCSHIILGKCAVSNSHFEAGITAGLSAIGTGSVLKLSADGGIDLIGSTRTDEKYGDYLAIYMGESTATIEAADGATLELTATNGTSIDLNAVTADDAEVYVKVSGGSEMKLATTGSATDENPNAIIARKNVHFNVGEGSKLTTSTESGNGTTITEGTATIGKDATWVADKLVLGNNTTLENNGTLTGTVTTADGATGVTIKGSGTFSALTVAKDTKLVVGNSPGLQTFDTALTLNNGSTTVFSVAGLEMASVGNAGWDSGTYSTITMGENAALTIEGGAKFVIAFGGTELLDYTKVDANGSLTQEFTLQLITGAGTLEESVLANLLTNTTFQLTDEAAGIPNDGNKWSISVKDATYANTDGHLVLTGKVTATIPEPTTATLSLLALAGLATRRRRR